MIADIVIGMDDPDRSIDRPTAGDQADPEVVDAALRRRRLVARLIALRKSKGLTQAAVADLMRVGQPVVAEIESARTDVRLSTLDRYARAVSLGTVELALVGDTWAALPPGGAAETLAPYGPAVGEADFWAAPSLEDLASEQRTGRIVDPRVLVLEEVSEHDWDDFFSEMGIDG